MAEFAFAPSVRLPPVARVYGDSGFVEISGLPSILRLSELQVDVDVMAVGLDESVAFGSAMPLKRTGNRVWEGALALIQHMRDRQDIPGAVVDLGAGTGVVGLAAHALGAQSVWLTDLPGQLPLLSSNASGRPGVEVCELDWRRLDQARAIAGRLEGAASLWVLACEVLYPRGLQGPDGLADDFFDALLTLLVRFNGPCLVLFAYEERSSLVTQAWHARVARDGFVAKIVAQQSSMFIFEIELPPAARSAAAARESAIDATSMAIAEQWAEVLAPHLSESEGGREAAERFARASSVGSSTGLVLWHVGRALDEYAPLRGKCHTVFSDVTLQNTLQNEGDDVRRRMASSAQAQMEELDARLVFLHLSDDVRLAHAAVGELQHAVRRLHTTLWGIMSDESREIAWSEPAFQVFIDGRDLTFAVPRRPHLETGDATQPTRVYSAIPGVVTAQPVALPVFADTPASLPASSMSLADALAILYSAVVLEASTVGDTWAVEMAEGLLAALDDGSTVAARAWLNAWVVGPDRERTAGRAITSSRRMEMTLDLESVLCSEEQRAVHAT